MRVMLDLHHLGQRQTGNESWASNIGKRLTQNPRGDLYDIAVTPTAENHLADLPAREILTVSESSLVRLAWSLPKALSRQHSSVALVQYSMPLTSTPCVVAIHDLSFEDPRADQWLSRKTRIRYRTTIRASAKRAAHVLALSECTRSDLISRYNLDPDRVTVVYAGLDTRLASLARDIPRTTPEEPTVLTVGNVLPRKNLGTVGRAIQLLRSRGQSVRLRVIGTIPSDGHRIATDLCARLGEAVSFSGYVSERQLSAEYRSASMLAFPSYYEGFGIPILEAMAAELPVIASNSSSIPEVAAEAALLLDPDDVESWMNAIHEVLNNTHLRQCLVARGLERASEFSWDVSAEQVRAVLRSVSEEAN